MRFDYLRDAAEIYRRSFALVRAEAVLDGLPEDLAELAVRLVHACGMPDVADQLAWCGDVVVKGRAALERGAPVIVDSRMVAAGIAQDRLPARNDIVCLIDQDGISGRAAALGTTRSAAAVELWRPRLGGAVVAIGTAPTALYRLLELLQEGAPLPAVIMAFPVGFVGAAEAKDALIEADIGVPYLTLRGRRGGSSLAAAAINALIGEAGA